MISYKRGVVRVEIQSLNLEEIINTLWSNKVSIANMRKLNITTIIMEVKYTDYMYIKEVARKAGGKAKIIGKVGGLYIASKVKHKFSLTLGVLLFFISLYFLSGYIWIIEIKTDKYMAPYEIRKQLLTYGIKPGTAKSKIDVYGTEVKFIDENDAVMWIKIRSEGAKLIVTVAERQAPPTIADKDEIVDVVAKKDGEIVRVYTVSGTAAVKPGQMVSKGSVLIKAVEGKEGLEYIVPAKGQVIAKTFYEYEKEFQIRGSKEEKSGNIITNKYITVFGKKIYFKKSLNNYEKYDKIEEINGIIKKETYEEILTKEFELNLDEEREKTVQEFYKDTYESLTNSATIIDNIVQVEQDGDNVKMRLIFVVEEEIS